jgi:predicted phage terminase large subunit-like protein
MKMDPERLCQTCMERPARKANSKYCDICVVEVRKEMGRVRKAIIKKVDAELAVERAVKVPKPRDHVAERIQREKRQGCTEHERLKPRRDAARARDKARKKELKVVAQELQIVAEEKTAKEMAQQELAKRELARRRLMPFIMRNQPAYLPGWVHTEICAELEAFSEAVRRKESPRLMIWVPPRHGKLVADNTPVMTPEGWRVHGDLCVGDYVFGPDGLPTKVVGVSAPDIACIEVTTTFGDTVKVHPAHEWTVTDIRTNKTIVIETSEMAALGTKISRHTPDGRESTRYRFRLPAIAPLQFDVAALPLDPYILGAWLGDGTSMGAQLTHAKGETQVVEAMTQNSRYSVHTVEGETAMNTLFAGGMRVTLRKIGVLGSKHIPDVYKHSAISQRLQLLAGLIDTDGSVEKSGRVRISNVNARLAGDCLELVRSLGWRANISTDPARRERTTGYAGKHAVYYVHFSPNYEIPTRIPRKAIGARSVRAVNSIISIRACPPEKGRCIEVERDDGLYLVGKRLTPTHNSMIASWHFPPWHLGNNPDHEVIAVSYAASLALGFSRKARALVQDDDFKKLFPKCKLNRDILNAENWQTTEGGGYRAAGVGGPMTGTGAHVLIIDDPVKNWEEADSETVRASTAEWYASTAYTRLAPGGGVLIIQTRWHEDDLSGRLAELMANDPEADQYRIIDYPAVAIQDERHRKEGEPLHPERYDAKALKRYENNVGPRVWNALYQQRPAPDSGAYFKKGWFKYYDIGHTPPNLDYYASWDLAITVKEDNDPTCGFVVGVDPQGKWWIVDRIHGRWETYDIVDQIINTMQRWNPAVTWIEKDKVQLAVGPVLERTMQERRVRNYVEEVPTGRKDKVMRARSLQGLMQLGMVYVPSEAPWLLDFENEMLKFPHAKHDDQVDSLAHMANQLAEMVGSRPPPVQYTQPISWKDKLGGLISKRSSHKSHLSA